MTPASVTTTGRNDYGMSRSRYITVIIIMLAMLALLVPATLLCGSVPLSAADVWHAITGAPTDNPAAPLIVCQTRVPMMLTAVIAGAALAVSGLLMQTTFDNPLAGPSILGISSGSSLGVAIVLLVSPALAVGSTGYYATTLTGAFIGAALIMLILIALASALRSTLMLLVAGILVSYLASSAISLLNFFATQEGVHSFVIWGLGTYSAMTPGRVAVMALVTVPPLLLATTRVKVLNAMLLGDSYARSLGVRILRDRAVILALSGILAATVTAFCGPIGFIGLATPHIARLAIGDSDHRRLLPATILAGALMSLLCAWISVIPASGVIPINAITPVVGVPVIIYIIVKRKLR